MKKILLIFLLFISLTGYSQKFINYYDFRDGSGTTLTDAVGSANGTIAGTSTAPAWANTNKYLIFTGGNAAAGDRGRIDFTRTTFDYAWNASFTWVIIYRSSKADALTHCVAKNRDAGVSATNFITYGIDASELGALSINSAAGQSKMAATVNTCDGKWHIIVISYSTNSQTAYFDCKLLSNTTDNNITSGNFYMASNKFTIGAVWNSTTLNYIQDLTGDVCRFINCNVKLTAADIQNISNEFNILY